MSFKRTSQIKHFFNQQLGNHKNSSDLFSIRKQRNKYVFIPNHPISNGFKQLVSKVVGEGVITEKGYLNMTLEEWNKIRAHIEHQLITDNYVPPIMDLPAEEKEELIPAAESQKTISVSVTKKESPAKKVFDEIRDFIDEKGFDTDNYSKKDIDYLYEHYEGAGGLAKEGVMGTTGILHEFYTPELVIEKMFGLAKKYGFKDNGKMLEPSCGIGRFLAYHNPALIDAYEIDKYAHFIATLKYPTANIKLASFEEKFFNGQFHAPHRAKAEYDLVIGNPPYDVNYSTQYAVQGEKKRTGAKTIDQYFLRAGLDVLKKGGLLVMLMPSSFMRNEHSYNEFKNNLCLLGDFITAYRLPNAIFPNTSVGTDIIIFQKI